MAKPANVLSRIDSGITVGQYNSLDLNNRRFAVSKNAFYALYEPMFSQHMLLDVVKNAKMTIITWTHSIDTCTPAIFDALMAKDSSIIEMIRHPPHLNFKLPWNISIPYVHRLFKQIGREIVSLLNFNNLSEKHFNIVFRYDLYDWLSSYQINSIRKYARDGKNINALIKKRNHAIQLDIFLDSPASSWWNIGAKTIENLFSVCNECYYELFQRQLLMLYRTSKNKKFAKAYFSIVGQK